MTSAPEVLWQPADEANTATGKFRKWLRDNGIIDVSDYAELQRWSVDDLDAFWAAVASYCGVRFHDQPTATLGSREMPGAQWFPGATVNYAEQSLLGEPDEAEAVSFVREDGLRERLTFGELRSRVAAARAGLRAQGVQRGDRVVALAPNCVQTLVVFLATASLGAVWSSCSPDFGTRAVTDRFVQIEPVVFVAVSLGISSTERLAASVRAVLLKGELEFPYHPHVTVAHHLDDAALDRAYDTLADYECTFEVEEFALYLHDESSGWSPHRRFALR